MESPAFRKQPYCKVISFFDNENSTLHACSRENFQVGKAGNKLCRQYLSLYPI